MIKRFKEMKFSDYFFVIIIDYWSWRRKNGDLQLKEWRSLKRKEEAILVRVLFGILVRKSSSLLKIVHAHTKRTSRYKLFFLSVNNKSYFCFFW
jgi:hypothetical protein